MYTLSDFDFILPNELIAQNPLPECMPSRLLIVKDKKYSKTFNIEHNPKKFEDRSFSDIPTLFSPGDLLVFNDTRVIKARFFGNKKTGGSVKIIIERVIGNQTVLAQIQTHREIKINSILRIANSFEVIVEEKIGSFYKLCLPGDPFFFIKRYGNLPLPPYIKRNSSAIDEIRYQTMYAKNDGSVAAPTAGLHFNKFIFEKLKERGVQCGMLTLHIGAGTFLPVRTNQLSEHEMHSEWYSIGQDLVEIVKKTRANGRLVIAVGTTTMRALESCARDAELSGLPSGSLLSKQDETDIFITPGYPFRIVDQLVTNFHFPKSTLMILVSAFAGLESIRAAYSYAINERYRFLSYGDAMLLTKKGQKHSK